VHRPVGWQSLPWCGDAAAASNLGRIIQVTRQVHPGARRLFAQLMETIPIVIDDPTIFDHHRNVDAGAAHHAQYGMRPAPWQIETRHRWHRTNKFRTSGAWPHQSAGQSCICLGETFPRPSVFASLARSRATRASAGWRPRAILRLRSPTGECHRRGPFQRGVLMSGTQRLPGGEPRKKSQRHTRRAAPLPSQISRVWRSGDRVRWRDRIGVFHRDLGDGEHAEIVIADRAYRVRVGDLT
jgi:hypothetical protein